MMTSYLRPPTFCVVCDGIVLESFSVACTLEAPDTTLSDIELSEIVIGLSAHYSW